MTDSEDTNVRGAGLSRRKLLYGVAAVGAAAGSGSGVAAFLTDEERTRSTFAAGTLDLDVDVQRPEAWSDGSYTGSIGVHESKTAEFDLSIDTNPAYVWLLTPCPTCEPIESNLDVRLELTSPSAGTVVLFEGSFRSFREQFSSGGPLSTDALPSDEIWTASFTWTLLAPTDSDIEFGFSFRAVQARHLGNPLDYEFDRPDCDDCPEEPDPECGKDISFAAFCSDEQIDEDDLSFALKRCGDTDRYATLEVTEIPDHVDEVLLKYATNLDVFEYDGESTPFTVTTGGRSEDLTFVDTYEQQGGEYPESGDPPRRNSDPCPGSYWVKVDADGGVETGSPSSSNSGDPPGNADKEPGKPDKNPPGQQSLSGSDRALPSRNSEVER
ncbi:hypothetical protein [Halobellus captivus]|uniref:hypothetical protein n=1 Tax=Halobellus captivus TaxID=2592614 RepID=UPI0011A20CB5|nr:hypothetical protein [Halobellus captivus]